MTICYVTHSAPCGKGETFIVQEIIEMKKYFQVVIIPIRPMGMPQYEDAQLLMNDSIILPLLNIKIIACFILTIFSNPFLVIGNLISLISESISLKVLLRNLCILPKAYYVTRVLKDKKIRHIHAHWSSIQTTFGLIVAKNLGIDFSFTAHRYDIDENNMLRKKVLEASFVRTISERGKNKIIRLTNLVQADKKIHVIHMGVKIPRFKNVRISKNTIPIIACPANLEEVKGHTYLVEACAILKSTGLKFKCLIIGSGSQYRSIKNLIGNKELENEVLLVGYYPHSKLIEMMKNHVIDIIVLPSITTKDGACEGIPVTLMEAMSFGIPVLSTKTGGIPELLREGGGIMVEEKDSKAIAQEVLRILSDENLREKLTKLGYQRIRNHFNITKTCEELSSLIQKSIVRIESTSVRGGADYSAK